MFPLVSYYMPSHVVCQGAIITHAILTDQFIHRGTSSHWYHKTVKQLSLCRRDRMEGRARWDSVSCCFLLCTCVQHQGCGVDSHGEPVRTCKLLWVRVLLNCIYLFVFNSLHSNRFTCLVWHFTKQLSWKE